MPDYKRIELSETSMAFWKAECFKYWNRYLKNLSVIRHLRRQNRQLRLIVSDYINEDKKTR